MAKNKSIGKAFKDTKKGTGNVARFLSKQGKSYVKSAKKTTGLSAKSKKPSNKVVQGGVLALTDPLKILRDNKKKFSLKACGYKKRR